MVNGAGNKICGISDISGRLKLISSDEYILIKSLGAPGANILAQGPAIILREIMPDSAQEYIGEIVDHVPECYHIRFLHQQAALAPEKEHRDLSPVEIFHIGGDDLPRVLRLPPIGDLPWPGPHGFPIVLVAVGISVHLFFLFGEGILQPVPKKDPLEKDIELPDSKAEKRAVDPTMDQETHQAISAYGILRMNHGFHQHDACRPFRMSPEVIQPDGRAPVMPHQDDMLKGQMFDQSIDMGDVVLQIVVDIRFVGQSHAHQVGCHAPITRPDEGRDEVSPDIVGSGISVQENKDRAAIPALPLIEIVHAMAFH